MVFDFIFFLSYGSETDENAIFFQSALVIELWISPIKFNVFFIHVLEILIVQGYPGNVKADLQKCDPQ
jgi:hypothetical protein